MSELGPTLTSSDRTATDELRRLLDERGVEWKGQEDIHTDFTFWCGVHACETGPKPSLAVYNLTPEQAIAATLGAGTCHDAAGSQMAFFACSACGAATERKHPRFCFACGRKVVDDG